MKCITCKNTIDIDSRYKTCYPCRAKDKVKREQTCLKMKVPTRTNVRNRNNNTTSASMNQGNACESRKVVAGVKRKARKSLYELEGEEQKVAIKMMKTSLNHIIRQQGKTSLPTPIVRSVSNDQEYQNASSLYDALKSKVLSTYPASNDGTQSLQFHGSHAIISVSSINNIQRTNLVATDLRKIARLSFELGNAMVSPGPSGSTTSSYPCNCLGHTQAVALPGSDPSNGPGSLIRWARANFASTASQAVPRICGGKVSVTVLDDNTHPLNILGQQIIVRVEHPNV